MGCAFSHKCVFPEFFGYNVDNKNPLHNTKVRTTQALCLFTSFLFFFFFNSRAYSSCLLPLLSSSRSTNVPLILLLILLLKYGIYEPGCGLMNVQFSFGHDEYLYQVLQKNNAKLPEEALYMIRFHSFYPWHKEGQYDHLCNDKDREMLPWVQRFNPFDLYSKSDERPEWEDLKEYYTNLINKYVPGKLQW